MGKNKGSRIGSTDNLFTLMLRVGTAMIGYNMHHSIFWTIMDFIFYPFALIKWFIMQEITVSIIRDTFSFFLK
jgi:hypothetical protein